AQGSNHVCHWQRRAHPAQGAWSVGLLVSGAGRRHHQRSADFSARRPSPVTTYRPLSADGL
ncbi:hypothetical protein, partial [Pseudomonas sp. FG-3G]